MPNQRLWKSQVIFLYFAESVLVFKHKYTYALSILILTSSPTFAQIIRSVLHHFNPPCGSCANWLAGVKKPQQCHSSLSRKTNEWQTVRLHDTWKANDCVELTWTGLNAPTRMTPEQNREESHWQGNSPTGRRNTMGRTHYTQDEQSWNAGVCCEVKHGWKRDKWSHLKREDSSVLMGVLLFVSPLK